MAWNRNTIVNVSARIFFILVIFQIPLFRIQCRAGMCITPVEVTASQLISSGNVPSAVVKSLVYPGAVVNGLISKMKIPAWDSILDIYNLTNASAASPMIELQRLEVLAGSYFVVAGSVIGIIKPGRMSLFGVLLIVWGLVKEGVLGKPEMVTEPDKSVYVYPTFLIALICAFTSIKYDIKKVIRNSQARQIAKPLQSSVKSKFN